MAILELFDCESDTPLHDGLRQLGWVEGRSIAFDCVSARDRLGQIDRIAAEIVARRPAVIVTSATSSIRALLRATRDIPIVMENSWDAVREGFVQSLARPGGNITGVTSISLDLLAKRFELAREILPAARRAALLTRRGADPAYIALFVPEFREAASRAGFDAAHYEAVDAADAEGVIAGIARDGFDLLYVGDGPAFTGPHAETMARHALASGLPLIGSASIQARAGGLFTYASNPEEAERKTARFVDRILRGARPSELPVEQPTRFELVVNAGTARALGLAVPPLILTRADEVIE